MDMNGINLMGLIIVLLMLVPNILYALTHRGVQNACTRRGMNLIEQVGRYGSMLLMVLPLGVGSFGFRSGRAFGIWLAGMAALLVVYGILWVVYVHRAQRVVALLLAIVPSMLFLLHGLLLRHWLLVLFGGLFGVGHIYVTDQNHRAG